MSLGASIAGCCFGGTPTPTPTPPPETHEAPQVPDDQVLVSVSASSQPTGASVTGGGALLGRTPFTTQVPVPRPQPGEAQSFEFTFQLPGYQSQTITASPVNNTLTLNVLLQPEVVGTPPVTGDPPVTGTQQVAVQAGAGTPGQVITVHGRGGGAITDFNTTRATASVPTSCVMGGLSIDIEGTHSYFSDLAVSLEGPDGTRYSIQRRGRANPFRTHTVRRARGHASAGDWVLTIADQVGQDSGVLRGFSMTITCQ
jgi:Proprotein convertase P-domain